MLGSSLVGRQSRCSIRSVLKTIALHSVSQTDDEPLDSDSAQEDSMSITSKAEFRDSSKVRTDPTLPVSRERTENVFKIAFTPINWSRRTVADHEDKPRTGTNNSTISAVSVPRAHITPSSSPHPEETQSKPSSSTPPASPNFLTPLDPEYHNNTIPPPAKPFHHPHSKPRPLSNYVWTMASVQGAMDYCNIQHNMELDLPYLKTMVAIDNYRKGVRGREPTAQELVEGLGELYGYGG